MPKCCTCSAAVGSTCANCVCAKNARPCNNQCCSRKIGQCRNPANLAGTPVKQVSEFTCPFDGCKTGKGQKRAHTADISKLHTHLNIHCSEGYSPPPSWLLATASRMCPDCDTRVTTLSSLCYECKNKPEPNKRVPRAQDLPSLQFNRVNQISLGLTKQLTVPG